MKPKFTISIETLKTSGTKPESTLINFRIEKALRDAFFELCQKELKQDASEVLRTIIRDLCKQTGYLK